MTRRRCRTCDFLHGFDCTLKNEQRAADDKACREYERDYWHRRERRVKREVEGPQMGLNFGEGVGG